MRPALLSKYSSTDARPTGLRSPAPLKMTSCIDSPRSADAFDSPSTQRTASMTFDLPQPLGPTMPTSCPGVAMVVGSTNDLKPESLIWVRRTGVLAANEGEDEAADRSRGSREPRIPRGVTVAGRHKRRIIADSPLPTPDPATPRRAGANPAAAGSRPSSTAWQATSPPPGAAASAGASRRQRSSAQGQRGWKAQPGGGSSGFGTSPATAVRATPVICRSGTASSSIRVYGCCGAPNSRRVGASSTMRPRYMTPTRSAMWWTTARLCEMNR